MKDKKGISLLLVILTTVILVGASVVAIIALILSASHNNGEIIEMEQPKVSLVPLGMDEQGNTCVQVTRGDDNSVLNSINFVINMDAGSYRIINSSVPSPGETKKYCFSLGQSKNISFGTPSFTLAQNLTNPLDKEVVIPGEIVVEKKYVQVECLNGQTVSCVSNLSGVCTQAFSTCVNNKFGACEVPNYQSPETGCSDEKDNDCDGLTDCADSDCDEKVECEECQPDESRECYNGAYGAGVGICKKGVSICDDSQRWSACLDEKTPEVEDCSNQLDDDCDGLVNEGCQAPVYYKDVDKDGYSDGTSSTTRLANYNTSAELNGHISGDCNDNNIGVHPGATEICGNDVDEDCSGADLICSPQTTSGGSLGKGCTTAFIIDKDCDGYGVGDGISIDADDNNSTFTTRASVEAVYGSLDTSSNMINWARHLGYNPSSVKYVSAGQSAPSGLQAGDLIVYRAGSHPKIGYYNNGLNGNSGNPIIFMAYPGEAVTIGSSGGMAVELYNEDLDNKKISNLVFDGFILNGGNPAAVHMYSNIFNVDFKNLRITENSFRAVYGASRGGLHNINFDGCVFGNHAGSHQIYIGVEGLPSTGDFNFADFVPSTANSPDENVAFRNSIFYRNGGGLPGIQFNGPMTGIVFENNIVHSMGSDGIAFYNGVANSAVRNNIIFNNGQRGVVFDVYKEDYAYQYRENNLFNISILNNIIWVGTNSPYSSSAATPKDFSSIWFDVPLTGFRYHDFEISNNILFSESGVGLVYKEKANDFKQNFNLRNNLFYRKNSQQIAVSYGGNYFDGSGVENYLVTQLTGFSSRYTGNKFGDPLFSSVLASQYNNAGAFNFSYGSGSPAINSGLASVAPSKDIRGNSRAVADIGAYDY